MILPHLTRSERTAKRWALGLGSFVLALLVWHAASGALVRRLEDSYEQQRSRAYLDRNGRLLLLEPNGKGLYDRFSSSVPERFTELLLKKEDRFFFSHPGVNPFSILRGGWTELKSGKRGGSSTLTQQLVKTLLGHESNRSVKNKLGELAYALALEWHASKGEIITMYANTAYFGGSAQGLTEASAHYFNLPPESLSDAQILTLLATLSNPSRSQVGSASNTERSQALARALGLDLPRDDWQRAKPVRVTSHRRTKTSFELGALSLPCSERLCQLTVDGTLSEQVRDILERNLKTPALGTAQNGAVIVIKLPENEPLSIIGSVDPTSQASGQQVNMAVRPRAIGSTAKPFIYLKAFEKGARPYTQVEDRELKYRIGEGFDFFPKNFDGQYRGTVTLHEALSNSLNVPSVQVLGYVGLEPFYRFLDGTLGFKPIQPLENYELSIALGGLEVDPLTLAHYFTLFPNGGALKPLTVVKSGSGDLPPYLALPMAEPHQGTVQAGEPGAVQLVNRILSDRETSVEQFGLVSSLNLPYRNYALKTGTSRDYHDSWTVGYTPDFLVLVWIGNSDGTPMRQVTGLSGAARVWHDVMQLLYGSRYDRRTPFDFSRTVEVTESGSVEFGLPGDDYGKTKALLLRDQLIRSPHDGDKFLLDGTTILSLEAEGEVTWSVNGNVLGRGEQLSWHPPEEGTYTIGATGGDGRQQEVTVSLSEELE